MDRRAVFFLGSAFVCALLLWPTPPELRWVGVALAVTYLVLAAASWLDHRSRARFDAGTGSGSDPSPPATR